MHFDKPRFLHVGYPKCASTSLQYDFFGAHPEIYHLGWGCQHTESGWVDEGLAAAMEVDLRMAKTTVYSPEAAGRALYVHFVAAQQNERYKIIGLSWESLIFTLAFDVDPAIKAQRLINLFGPGTKILIVIRNQLDLIRSMYFEMVRDGLAKPFADYLEFLHFYDFLGLTLDLCYSRIVQLYADLFGYRSVLVVPFERLVSGQTSELHRVCDFLGISRFDGRLGHHNPSSDLRLLECVRRLNAELPHNFGAEHYSFIDAAKITTYWKREEREIPSKADWSIRTPRRVLENARAVLTDDVPPIDAAYPPKLRLWFEKLYAPSNRELERIWKIDLSGLGYPV